MGRVDTASLYFALLSLLLSVAGAESPTPTPPQPASSTVSCDRFHKTGFWDVDIDNWPALAPDCLPPISRGALRDPSRLPGQICAIIGSYLFFICCLGALLVTIGRRMRRNAQTSSGTLEIEMVNSGKKFEMGSPTPSSRSWMRGPLKSIRSLSSSASRASSNPASPGIESVISFDSKVVNQDRESRQAEMERLYAAVMVHDEAKRSTQRISQAQTVQSDADGIETSSQQGAEAMRKKLRVQISESNPTEIPRSPSSLAPKSPYKAIYPPYPSPGANSLQSGMQSPMTPMTPITPRSPHRSEMPHDMWPASPVSPKRVELPDDMYPASPPPEQVKMQLPQQTGAQPDQPPPTPRSFGRQSHTSNSDSSSKSRKFGVKNLRISAPLRSNDDAEEREPLSPRLYNPPAPPSPPDANGQQPPTPHTGVSVESDGYAAERLDEPKPLPSAQPQRKASNLSISLPSGPSSSKTGPISAGVVSAGPNNPLPFRAFQNASAVGAETPVNNALSPGPVKTTFLERKIERLGRGPLTARTPRTGVPMTPYSPYMPFTPVTPVTPGLVSRRERKERIKAEGRKVLVEEDEVKDKEEMWDTGY